MSNKDEIVAKLAETRAPLMTFLQNLDEAQWETAVQSEDAEWTISDIVRHLVSAESGMTGLIIQFQQGKDPVPPDFDRERFNKRAVEKTKSLTPPQLLEAMTTNRAKLLDVIDTLTEEDWQKNGRHASLNIYTIEEVCQIIAGHEELHFEDMQKAVHF